MNILIINGSPKGNSSVTLQTSLYLKKVYSLDDCVILNAGQKIKSLEKDFSEAVKLLEKAELVIFSYPVYTFIAPYQLHRFIELMKTHGISLAGKSAAQITTSKHFYDMTAHKFIEENCLDMGAKYIGGLSADMDDLLTEKGRLDAVCFFEKMMFNIENGIFKSQSGRSEYKSYSVYKSSIPEKKKTLDRDVVIVTNAADDDENLINMTEDFRRALSCKSRVVNVRKYPFAGGCLGCFRCAATGKCVYKDGFDDYLRNNIQSADAIVYAFRTENHYTHSSFKCYDDRQFCNGHRTVTMGMPAGYIISGGFQFENNLQTIIEGRLEVGGVLPCGIASDDDPENTEREIEKLALSVDYALTHKITKPSNFYGVGGMKIFRDLIYVMRGLMKADHKFYKENGIYDFPQKQKGRIIQMKLVGALMSLKTVQKKMGGKMNGYIIQPYKKVIETAKIKKHDDGQN